LAQGARDEAEVSLLEVACGTGRFHTFIKVTPYC
jgi:ubiquinone/menaquinone biosynthesis C-methylase UbiE